MEGFQDSSFPGVQPWSRQPAWFNTPTKLSEPPKHHCFCLVIQCLKALIYAQPTPKTLGMRVVVTLNCPFRPWSSSCLSKMTRNWASQANLERALPNHLTESPQLRSWKLAYPTDWVNLADGHVIDLPCSEEPSAPLPWIYHMWYICASICSLKSELCWWQFFTSIHIYIYHIYIYIIHFQVDDVHWSGTQPL